MREGDGWSRRIADVADRGLDASIGWVAALPKDAREWQPGIAAFGCLPFLCALVRHLMGSVWVRCGVFEIAVGTEEPQQHNRRRSLTWS